MKVAFIYNFKKSDWKSCEVITSNLLKTYTNLLNNVEVLHFSLGIMAKEFEQLKLAREIFNAKPTHIIIIDHKPHPKSFFKFIDQAYLERSELVRPEIIVHVFGDFTLYSREWKDSEEYLKNFQLKLVCASDRQKELIGKFLNNNEITFKCPFPVDNNHYFYSPSARKATREKLGLSDTQAMFLYTGRMSLQKKILELTFDFSQFLEITKADAYLYMAGDYDDLGNPYTGAMSGRGEFCQRHLILIQGLKPEIRSRIRYIGNLNQEELLAYYNAADCYVSLSVHNDEDYGMSPAEAICTGLPAILTDWAGYASFNLNEKNYCKLIPVEYDNKLGLKHNSKMLLKELILFLNYLEKNRNQRKELEKLNTNVFSIDANKVVVKKILDAPVKKFEAFSDLLEEFAQAFENEKPPFATYKYEINYTDLYKEAYASYLRK